MNVLNFSGLENYILYPVIAGVAVIFIAAVLVLLFKKKTPKNKAGSEGDRKAVEQNARLVDVLIAIETDADGKAKLELLKEKLKYLMPSEKDEVYAKDVEIKRALDDFKIAITKKPDKLEVVEDNVKEIEILVTERNSYI